LPDFEARTPFSGKDAFVYDAGQDACHCRQGQLQPRRKTKSTEEEVVYRADVASRNVGLVKPKCTASDHGHMIDRSLFAV
jgi:hypothetical protein